jgi:uncharacterized protein
MGAIPPRLTFVTLGVRDMPTMRGFYTGLGWTQQPGASDQFCSFLLGGVLLALYGIDDLAAEAARSSTAPGAGAPATSPTPRATAGRSPGPPACSSTTAAPSSA